MSRWLLAFSLLAAGGVGGAYLGTTFFQAKVPAHAAASAAIPRDLTSYRDIVKKVLPAVVSIESKSRPAPRKPEPQPRRRPQGEEGQVPDPLRRFFEDFQGQGPDMEDVPRQGFGSGFLVDPKGVILTNHHVVDRAEQVEVQLQDGRKFTSKDIRIDPRTDLAIVRIDAGEALPYLEMGDSTAMEQGDRVLAVGAPFGLTGSVTSGIVSAKGRSLRIKPLSYEDFIQTDAAINPGNSGGALVDSAGRLIGINTAIVREAQGIGFAIPVDIAVTIMNQLIKTGRVVRPALGIVLGGEIDPNIQQAYGLPVDHGVIVQDVPAGSPAATAGVQANDIIIAINGQTVKSINDLRRTLFEKEPGDRVQVQLVRGSQRLTVTVVLTELRQ
jgi:serine protease Do